MKKIISLFIVMLMSLTFFAGCSNKNINVSAKIDELTPEIIAKRYNCTVINDCTPKDFTKVPEEQLNDAQKEMNNILMNVEWNGGTFIDSDNNFVSLVEYFKQTGLKPVGGYVDYPSIFFLPDNVFVYTCGEVLLKGAWEYNENSTDVLAYIYNDDKVGVIRICYDEEVENLYVIVPEEYPVHFKVVYSKESPNVKQEITEKITGRWIDVVENVDGIVEGYEKNIEFSEEEESIVVEPKDIIEYVFSEGAKVKCYKNGEEVFDTTYKIDEYGYCFFNDTLKNKEAIYYYDSTYDMMVTIPLALDKDSVTYMLRANDEATRDIVKEDIVGKWVTWFSSYGQDYNSYDSMKKMDEYFDLDYASEYGGYELCFNEDGTGYSKESDESKETAFTYVIKGTSIVITNTSDESQQAYEYNNRLGKITYINGNVDDEEESMFRLYVRKD